MDQPLTKHFKRIISLHIHWEHFVPTTTLLFLHYILVKISKQHPEPTRRRPFKMFQKLRGHGSHLYFFHWAKINYLNCLHAKLLFIQSNIHLYVNEFNLTNQIVHKKFKLPSTKTNCQQAFATQPSLSPSLNTPY